MVIILTNQSRACPDILLTLSHMQTHFDASGADIFNPYPHTILQQTTSNIFCQKIKNYFNWIDQLWLKVEKLWQKEKGLVLSNFFLCRYVFKKLSAAEATESVYMRERVNPFPHADTLWQTSLKSIKTKREYAFNEECVHFSLLNRYTWIQKVFPCSCQDVFF